MARLPHIDGAPDSEHVRSPAARSTALLAARSQLFFAHYEHRESLPWPSRMRPEGSGEDPGEFVGGVLPEPKYGAFRHDLLIASFHPGHRAQWTAHELCHALVGFAYRPSASRLFHVLAAWLAELLPVSLWYFFDEAGLSRCPAHRSRGPLFQRHCDACEIEALKGPRTDDAEGRRRIREGRAFMDRELRAIARARRTGECEGTRYATVDLASDALAYVRGHGLRLAAPETARWADRFFDAGQGLHHDLDALEARVIAVREAMLEGRPLPAHRATRWDYAAQDVGYRLSMVRADLDGTRAGELDRIIDALADDRSERGMARAVTAYEALATERASRRGHALPAASRMFAVGYPLVGSYGRSVRQVGAGVASACPSTFAALGRAARATVSAFTAEDAPLRQPIGRRFAAWLSARRHDGIADLARLEAAITHAAAPDEKLRTMSGEAARDARVRLAPHAELVHVTHAVAGAEASGIVRLPRVPEFALAVVRDAHDGLDVMELPVSVACALRDTRVRPASAVDVGLSPDDAEALLQAGLLVPAAYKCDDVAPTAASSRTKLRSTQRAVRESSEVARKTPRIER